jgi:large subunit ribosomal protein L9|tara:strand:+ start:1942 stop:2403 length:462 start_codon:yes stop_codon:yes gene_type:complete
MQIILLENIKNLGNIGDVLNVKRGYARNYLIKNNKALYASEKNINEVNKKKAELNKKDLEVKKDAKKLFNLLNNKTFKVKKLVTENNELYGSVKPTEISKIIFEKENIKVKPSQMDLETGIKTVGMFKVNINLHAEIQANILIQVEKLEDNKI